MVVKIFRSLPSRFLIKTTAMRESNNLDSLTPKDAFSELKAFEFELNSASDVVSNPVIESGALIASIKGKTGNKGKASDISEDEELALLNRFRKFLRYEKKGNSPKHQGQNSYQAPVQAQQQYQAPQYSVPSPQAPVQYQAPIQNLSAPVASKPHNARLTNEQKMKTNLCYNCRKPGHFQVNCPYPNVSKPTR